MLRMEFLFSLVFVVCASQVSFVFMDNSEKNGESVSSDIIRERDDLRHKMIEFVKSYKDKQGYLPSWPTNNETISRNLFTVFVNSFKLGMVEAINGTEWDKYISYCENEVEENFEKLADNFSLILGSQYSRIKNLLIKIDELKSIVNHTVIVEVQAGLQYINHVIRECEWFKEASEVNNCFVEKKQGVESEAQELKNLMKAFNYLLDAIIREFDREIQAYFKRLESEQSEEIVRIKKTAVRCVTRLHI